MEFSMFFPGLAELLIIRFQWEFEVFFWYLLLNIISMEDFIKKRIRLSRINISEFPNWSIDSNKLMESSTSSK